MITNPRIRFSVIFTISIILLILSRSVSFADADKVFKENSNAVVVVITYNEKGKPISQGSGFIVRTDGAVVTNYHVISNAKSIKVKAGNKVLDVEGLIYIDKENDIVILKVKGENLPAVKLGRIETARIRETVYVISSPKGLENTISDGILSGTREITLNKKILQITASISPGSSGAPVFNKDGEVIGIATFIIKEAQNLNFAMSVNLIKDKIDSKKVTALKDSALEDYKKTADYWFYSGYYLEEAGMHKESIEANKQAIRIKPDFAEAHYNLGRAYGNLGRYKEAIESFKQAIRIKPDFANAHNNIAFTYLALNDRRSAVEQYEILKDLDPELATELFDFIKILSDIP